MDMTCVHYVWAVVITDSVYLNPILINKRNVQEIKKKKTKKIPARFFTLKVGVTALIKFYMPILSMNLFC